MRPKKVSFNDFVNVAKRNFNKTDGLLYALLYVYIVTFSVYPGVAYHTSLKFLDGLPNSVSWFIVFINTVCSLFDTFGRKLGGIKLFDLDSFVVKIISVSRTIFICTFLLIALDVPPIFIF